MCWGGGGRRGKGTFLWAVCLLTTFLILSFAFNNFIELYDLQYFLSFINDCPCKFFPHIDCLDMIVGSNIETHIPHK